MLVACVKEWKVYFHSLPVHLQLVQDDWISLSAERKQRGFLVLTDAGSCPSPVNNSGCSADAAAAPIGTEQHFLNRRKDEGIVEGFFSFFFMKHNVLYCLSLSKRLPLSFCL